MARRGLDVAADQHALQQLLVLVVAEGALGGVAEQLANRLDPLLRRLAGGQRAAGELVRDPEVAQRLADRLAVEPA